MGEIPGLETMGDKGTRPIIIVFVSHSDDQVIGPGGAIAKYAKQGYRVETVICSFGERSHPHLKPEVIRKTRVLEAKKADEILGGSGVAFLGLKEGHFAEDMKKDKERLLVNFVRRLRHLRPKIIFTHSPYDNHPDHKACYKLLLEAVEQSHITTEVYTFTVWKIVNPERMTTPQLVLDISREFSLKIKALNMFKSQMSFLTYAQLNNLLYLGVYLRAFLSGLQHGVKYAEAFSKVVRAGQRTNHSARIFVKRGSA